MALRVLVEEGMIGNAAPHGRRLLDGLARRSSRDIVREVRGRGLMIAVELDPAAGGARRYCERLRELGVLCKETHDPHDPGRAAAGHRCGDGGLGGRSVRDRAWREVKPR